MRLAVDLMGGDQGPEELLHGVQLGLRETAEIQAIYVVGRESQVRPILSRLSLNDPRLHLVHAEDVLEMDDKPVQAIRRKRDCSLLRAVDLVRDGEADAMISSGNTGGIVAAATIRLRTLAGVDRPTIACILPSRRGAFVLVDGGANPECSPVNLLQFALMGAAYSKALLEIPRPRVGVLSNGTEESKGTDLTRGTLALLRQTDLNCIGYCEGNHLFDDAVDVAVCDGLVGNIVLKTAEGMGRAFGTLLREELSSSVTRSLGAILARPGLKRIKERMNPDVYGGAPLLGLRGTVIKIHGSAKRMALKYAIRQCQRLVNQHLNEAISHEIARFAQPGPTPDRAIHS